MTSSARTAAALPRCGDQRRESPVDGGLARQSIESPAGGVALPAPVTAAETRGAARDDDHVADLTGEATATADQLAVGDDAAADAGAERHHDEVVDTATGAPLVFAERGAVGVVLAEHHRARERR